MKALETLILFWRGFGLVFKASPALSVVLFILNVLVALAPATSLWILKLIVDKLTSIAAGSEYQLVHLIHHLPELSSLLGLLGLQFCVWLLTHIMSSLQDALSSNARNNFEYYVQTRIMRKCGEMDMAFFENSSHQDRLDKVVRGASMSAWNLIWMSFGIVGSAVTMTSFLVITAKLHWIAPIVVVFATAPQMMASAHFARKRWQLFTQNTSDMRLRNYVKQVLSSSDAATEVKLYGLADYLVNRFSHYAGKFYMMENDLARRTSAVDFVLGSLSTVVIAVIWAYVIVLAFARAITAGDALLYFQATSSCRSNLLGLFTQGGRLYEHMLFLSDLFEFFDTQPGSIDGALHVSDLKTDAKAESLTVAENLSDGIEFDHVSFRYPGMTTDVLTDVSFRLPAVGSVAIVGKNGAGKSTLVKLLVRLYDPTAGRILLDGNDIKDLDPGTFRKHFSVVFQNFHRYFLSLRENIGFGDIFYVDDMEKIEKASGQVGVDAISRKLTNGYQTYLSRQYNAEGEELSTGQWQKIALARGLMRSSPVVILDEPTASLDAFGEFEMYRLFEEMTRDRLSVLISHRFSTVRMADTILVLDDGRIVESGSHKDLMEAGGLYASMYSTQADRYR